MAEKRYYWLKLFDDFFTSKRIKKLRNLAGGDTYTIIYLKMQLKSLKDEGYLYFDGVMDDFAEELALDIDEKTEDVKNAIRILTEYGLFEQIDSVTYKVNRKARDERNRGASEYKLWRKSVFERDNYTCQKCHKKGVKLNAHHIKPWCIYKDERFEISNGITLCEKCHKEIHRRK